MHLSYVHASISPSSLKGFQPPVIEEHIERDSLYIYIAPILVIWTVARALSEHARVKGDKKQDKMLR